MGSFLSLRQPTTEVYCSDTSATVSIRRPSSKIEQVALAQAVRERCPSVFSVFKSNPWLFNGHLQTLYQVTADFSKVDEVIYKRKYIRLVEGGTLGLDFTHDKDDLREDAPIIVVLHGLTGGSHESYVRTILAPACAPAEKGGLGYRGVVVNFRGCAGTPLTSPQLYSGAHTDDIRQAVVYIAHQYPKAPLLGLGFSLGANVLTRYIAEEGDQCRLVAGCVLACPWNLERNNIALQSTFIGRQVYSQGMGANLHRLLKHHAAALGQFKTGMIVDALTEGLALKKPSMEKFDDTFTRRMGGSSPPFPFPSAVEYYKHGSSHKKVKDIMVPFLAINADDDPIVREIPKEAGRSSGWTTIVVTPHGGHLGWFLKRNEAGVMTRWIKQPVLEWMKFVAEDLVSDRSRARAIREIDGFWTEEGRENLGHREIEEGGLVIGTQGEEGLIQGL